MKLFIASVAIASLSSAIHLRQDGYHEISSFAKELAQQLFEKCDTDEDGTCESSEIYALLAPVQPLLDNREEKNKLGEEEDKLEEEISKLEDEIDEIDDEHIRLNIMKNEFMDELEENEPELYALWRVFSVAASYDDQYRYVAATVEDLEYALEYVEDWDDVEIDILFDSAGDQSANDQDETNSDECVID